ncbi:MAG: 50S ribosomal protein L6 [Rhodospirillales bacterium]|nr:50S ribosomal protein L6 [Rhodospirillales bacterium]
MSRVGRQAVSIPSGVSVEVAGQICTAKGKLGQLSFVLPRGIEAKVADGTIVVNQLKETKILRAMWGTARNRLHNLVQGVAQGYVREIEINGVGFRAQVQGKEAVFQIGYSHEVRYPIPAGIKITCPDQTHVRVEGMDKHRVGQTAAEIRGLRLPEPYKGKGIQYVGEKIRRKEGKKK